MLNKIEPFLNKYNIFNENIYSPTQKKSGSESTLKENFTINNYSLDNTMSLIDDLSQNLELKYDININSLNLIKNNTNSNNKDNTKLNNYNFSDDAITLLNKISNFQNIFTSNELEINKIFSNFEEKQYANEFSQIIANISTNQYLNDNEKSLNSIIQQFEKRDYAEEYSQIISKIYLKEQGAQNSDTLYKIFENFDKHATNYSDLL